MNAIAPVHPTDQTLRSYGMGKLDDAEANTVSHHLETCSDSQSRPDLRGALHWLVLGREQQGQEV
jgi:anti-sigma factor ChrR (cupin superfamily)